MFVPVDRALLAVTDVDGRVHAAETASVVITTRTHRRLAPTRRWTVLCGAQATGIVTVAASYGCEPFASAWPPEPENHHALRDMCGECTTAADG